MLLRLRCYFLSLSSPSPSPSLSPVHSAASSLAIYCCAFYYCLQQLYYSALLMMVSFLARCCIHKTYRMLTVKRFLEAFCHSRNCPKITQHPSPLHHTLSAATLCTVYYQRDLRFDVRVSLLLLQAIAYNEVIKITLANW